LTADLESAALANDSFSTMHGFLLRRPPMRRTGSDPWDITAGWLEQAHGFYAGFSSAQRFAQALGRFGYDDTELAAEAALIAEVRKKSQAQVQSNGASRSAEAARDLEFRELDVWVSDFRTICTRSLLRESPGAREARGDSAERTEEGGGKGGIGRREKLGGSDPIMRLIGNSACAFSDNSGGGSRRQTVSPSEGGVPLAL